MKQYSFLFLFFLFSLISIKALSQANASINILTQNSGIVYLGGVGYVQVDIGNTGPVSSIGVNKVRAQISIPSNCQAVPNAQQNGLPSGWIILNNAGSVIQVCNGTDVIPVNVIRTILIKVQGVNLGGPSTVTGVLSFGPGTGVCTGPGSLPGDITADNTSTSTINVINAPSCNLLVSATAGTIVCNGGSTTITATATNGNGTIEYSISGNNFQSSNTFTVTAGTYTITARETLNPSCITSTTISVSEPAILPAPTIGTITQTSCTIGTGSVELQNLPSGNWTIQPGNITGSGTSTTITGLAPGTYNFSVANAQSCTSLSSASVLIHTQPLTPSVPLVTIVQPTCTDPAGTILPIGSTTGLNYSLNGAPYNPFPASGFVVNAGNYTLTAMNSNGCVSGIANIVINPQPITPVAPTVNTIIQPTCIVSTGSVELVGLPNGNWTIQPGNIVGSTTSTTVTGLSTGTYNFTVTNANGCTSPLSSNVVINNNATAPQSPTVSVVQPTCTNSNGIVTITSTITPDVLLSVDGGPFTTYPVNGYSLPSGNHSIVLQNATGCSSLPTLLTINPQPPTPSAPTIEITQPGCTNSNGTVVISSNTTGLTFSLNNAQFSAYPTNGYSLSTGTYTLAAQNTNGCISTLSTFVINTQPSTPSLNIITGNVNCNGGSAIITANALGGTSPYQYSFNNGPLQSANTITLPAGNYTAAVIDANGCGVSNVTFTVNQPPALNAAFNIDSIKCNGNTGTITIQPTGGVSPYTYNYNNGSFQGNPIFQLAAGNYTFQVKDANNCNFNLLNVVLVEPTPIIARATANRILNCGGEAEVTVTASGGTTPYISGIGTFRKSAGTWIFNVVDANGCTSSDTLTIEAPGCIVLIPFPNPANDVLKVHHSTSKANAVFRIYDITGKIVLSKTIVAGQIQSSFDIRKLSAGNYVIEYINGNEKQRVMFTKRNN